MNALVHLRTEEIRLQPGEEWMDGRSMWRFLRVDSGAAYWLGEPRTRALAEGELAVIPPGAKGVVRASQLNEVVLHGVGYCAGTSSIPPV